MIENRIDRNFQNLFEKYGYNPKQEAPKSVFEQLKDCETENKQSLNEALTEGGIKDIAYNIGSKLDKHKADRLDRKAHKQADKGQTYQSRQTGDEADRYRTRSSERSDMAKHRQDSSTLELRQQQMNDREDNRFNQNKEVIDRYIQPAIEAMKKATTPIALKDVYKQYAADINKKTNGDETIIGVLKTEYNSLIDKFRKNGQDDFVTNKEPIKNGNYSADDRYYRNPAYKEGHSQANKYTDEHQTKFYDTNSDVYESLEESMFGGKPLSKAELCDQWGASEEELNAALNLGEELREGAIQDLANKALKVIHHGREYVVVDSDSRVIKKFDNETDARNFAKNTSAQKKDQDITVQSYSRNEQNKLDKDYDKAVNDYEKTAPKLDEDPLGFDLNKVQKYQDELDAFDQNYPIKKDARLVTDRNYKNGHAASRSN